ncbi:MAG TPA: DUF1015 family protein [bacterium]|nr:DUF1015 family protein [bacterium]HOX85606.1 DUF1015 family protein [bacterium]HPG44765.1 DUF1015 family protein [bacterium]HPM99063.1 DUF1015 family protein [bacterium]
MIKIKPLRGLRPAIEFTAQVASPPYDVLSSAEARDIATNNPLSFLHINKPEIDLPPEIDIHGQQVYEQGRANLERFIRDGVLIQDEKEAIYIYRQTWQDHVQTGYFCLSSVQDYDQGRIKKHELTRADKEQDRTHLIDVMDAQVGPVFLMYRSQKALDLLLQEAAEADAEVDLTTADGVRHQLWRVIDPHFIARIVDGFAALAATYIADGHHRSAAASNVCRLRRQRNPQNTGEESYNFFLSVLFPHNQLKILPYNRAIRDLNGYGAQQFIDRLAEKFSLEPVQGRIQVEKEHTFGMYLDHVWWKLTPKDGLFDRDDVLGSLDVNILLNHILQPILQIGNPRTDPRIDFIGGIRGNAELERIVDSGAFRIAFSLYPTTVDTLMRVADAGEIMPPKSTWFEPKLRSGLVVHLLHDF